LLTMDQEWLRLDLLETMLLAPCFPQLLDALATKE